MLTSGMVSSGEGRWETPAWLYDTLNGIFKFRLDAAASLTNTKCDFFYGDAFGSSLNLPWFTHSPVWLNPPYGRNLRYWIEKCIREAALGATIVALLPARTDTKWFRRVWETAQAACFLYKRVRFEMNGAVGKSPPFPSVIAIWTAGVVFETGPLKELGRLVWNMEERNGNTKAT